MAPGESKERKCSFEKTFNFTSSSNSEISLKLSVVLPISGTIKEYAYRVMQVFHVPFYVFDGMANCHPSELYASLKDFAAAQTIKLYDEIGEKDLEETESETFDIEEVVKYWEKNFKNETVEYSEPVGTTDEELFSTVYHKLVHSPALESILQEEHSYAVTAGAADAKRRKLILDLTEKQNNEIADAVRDLHTKVTEKDINDLAAKHFEEHSLAAGRLNSEVEALHENQRKQYRAWLMNVLEEQATQSPEKPQAVIKISNGKNFGLNHNSKPWPQLEESFTIHLGSQMKQMHNVRILSADILDFCRITSHADGMTEIEPQRLETALALYSNGLSGLVLLCDVGPIDGFTGLSKDFANVCEQTAEFHFSTFDNQLQEIRNQVKEGLAWRQGKMKMPNDFQQAKRNCGSSKNLQTGDMFITKHSNLSQVHVVFHMLVDDSVKSSDMNSRHPVILGLRNVLKTAASYDVTTITVPLLLTHEMTEDMTVAWCSKRAELVFKCVKGFMIEAAGAGGAELHNLQFLVPTKISSEVFSTLASMLPSIFRVSNPLVLKTSTINHYMNCKK